MSFILSNLVVVQLDFTPNSILHFIDFIFIHQVFRITSKDYNLKYNFALGFKLINGITS